MATRTAQPAPTAAASSSGRRVLGQSSGGSRGGFTFDSIERALAAGGALPESASAETVSSSGGGIAGGAGGGSNGGSTLSTPEPRAVATEGPVPGSPPGETTSSSSGGRIPNGTSGIWARGFLLENPIGGGSFGQTGGSAPGGVQDANPTSTEMAPVSSAAESTVSVSRFPGDGTVDGVSARINLVRLSLLSPGSSV